MKKKLLSLAVAAGLVGAVTAAHAEMHINGNGTGEALVYPFYSANGGNDTYVHVVNTTGYTKAVKVRFIEAMNSQEVLDFNLYLSPEDEWAGAITANPNGSGALIRTVDNSCTVPELGTAGGANTGELAGTQTTRADGKIVRDQPFVNFKYDIDGEDIRGLERTLEGYIEIIEMGQLDPTTGKGAMAVHGANGVPANCDGLVAAWSSTTTGNQTTEGDWVDDSQDELLEWDGGGLYGYGVVINVAEGTAAGYDAVAIDTFYDTVIEPNLHAVPGEELPSLANANAAVTIFDGANANDYLFDDGAEAVSALFMSANIANDYVIDEDINALTDWVVTMPTKRFFVQDDPAVEPFANFWDGATACEPVALEHWDREEAFVPPPTSTDEPVFSPQPPQIEITPDDFVLCTEVSVVSMGAESALNASGRINYGFTPGYMEGWARMSFDPQDLNDPTSVGTRTLVGENLADQSPTAFYGLPVTGFAVFNYQNGTLGDGTVLANYAASSEHKVEQLIEAVEPQ